MKDRLLVAALLLLATGLVFNAIFPRYEWTVRADGATVAVIVYDRWLNRYQEADFQEDGTLTGRSTWFPF